MKPNVLVVEDDEIWRNALVQTFRKLGVLSGNAQYTDCEVQDCANYETALRILSRDKTIHCISLDWHIQSHADSEGVFADGILEFIREERKNIVPIVTTGLAEEKHRAIHKGRTVWRVCDKGDYASDLQEFRDGKMQGLPTLAQELEKHAFVEALIKRNPELLPSVAKASRPITPNQWWDVLQEFPLTKDQICELCHVSDKTVQNWKLEGRKSGSNYTIYNMGEVRRCAADKGHSLTLSDEVIKTAVRNFVSLYCKHVRPRISEENLDDAAAEAYAGGLQQLALVSPMKPETFQVGVIEGVNVWLRSNRRQFPNLGDSDRHIADSRRFIKPK